MRTPQILPVACLTFAIAAWPGELTAQAAISGLVVDARTARPVPDASVRIASLFEERVTDREGRFHFTGIGGGTVILETRHIGFTTRTDTLRLEGETEARIQIRLVEGAIQLPPITVETFARRLEQAGFFRRRARGMGTFLTREQILAHKPENLGDVFSRVSGLRRVMTTDGTSHIDSRGGTITNRCDIQYFIDGVPAELDAAGVDGIPVHVVEGIEVYRGGSQVPTQFDRGRAMCGAVVIWTRGG